MLFPEYLHFSSFPHALDEVLGKLAPDLVTLLVDENTRTHCLPLLNIEGARVIEIPSGEQHKTLRTCEIIWEQMTQMGMSKKSVLINFGGGVIGDMGGFCANTFKRGIPFINIPTTLLSMVDASIGGKLGINFNGLKNHIGLFGNPEAVLISADFLKTLPSRQLKSGFAEVLKHALIADKNYWETIKQIDFPQGSWDTIIRQSIAIKADVVAADPLENGRRKILNFGHSFGHAIETHFLEIPQPLLHGEAIAVGMLLEAHISFQKKWLTESEFTEIETVIQRNFSLPELPELDSLFPLMHQDKKNQGDGLNFSLIDKIGDCRYDVKMELLVLKQALDHYKKIR